MHALILAAGIGNRLSDAAGDLPKCLLEFNQKTLLQRHIDALLETGVMNITVVIGYKADVVKDRLARITPQEAMIKTVQNDDYLQGSVVSLWSGRDVLASGDTILLMDADVLYSPQIMIRLAGSEHNNCFLLDRDFEPGEEPVKLCIKNDRIIEFRKNIEPQLDYDIQGESVGFFKYSPEACQMILAQASHYVDNNRRDEPYEEVLRDVVRKRPDLFGYEDISGLPWIEIDFPQDIERASSEILPEIESDN